AAATAGYVLSNYDLDVTCMGNVPGIPWVGVAFTGTAGAWIRGTFNTGVVAHELGHNFGLSHSGLWKTTDGTVIGSGFAIEQGDAFDTMGFAWAGSNHFNAHSKYYLNWLTTNEVQT